MLIVADESLERQLVTALAVYSRALSRDGRRLPKPLSDLLAGLADSGGHARPAFGDPLDNDHDDDVLLFDEVEIAAILRCSDRTVRRLVRSGELAAVKIANKPLIRAEDLRQYIASLPSTSERKQS